VPRLAEPVAREPVPGLRVTFSTEGLRQRSLGPVRGSESAPALSRSSLVSPPGPHQSLLQRLRGMGQPFHGLRRRQPGRRADRPPVAGAPPRAVREAGGGARPAGGDRGGSEGRVRGAARGPGGHQGRRRGARRDRGGDGEEEV
jgi:hypothetical protein